VNSVLLEQGNPLRIGGEPMVTHSAEPTGPKKSEAAPAADDAKKSDAKKKGKK
jgi:hypothetical protein